MTSNLPPAAEFATHARNLTDDELQCQIRNYATRDAYDPWDAANRTAILVEAAQRLRAAGGKLPAVPTSPSSSYGFQKEGGPNGTPGGCS